MQKMLEKLLAEVTYHTGEVVSDPQIWSDTDVHGGGYVGGHHGGSVSISSSVTTWTSFIIQKADGKEYMAKLPYAFPARKGHTVIAADFRGSTIAAANDATDELSGTLNVVRGKLTESQYKNSGKKLLVKVLSPFFVAALLFFVLILAIGESEHASMGIMIGGFIALYILLAFSSISTQKTVKSLDKKLPSLAEDKIREMMSS